MQGREQPASSVTRWIHAHTDPPCAVGPPVRLGPPRSGVGSRLQRRHVGKLVCIGRTRAHDPFRSRPRKDVAFWERLSPACFDTLVRPGPGIFDTLRHRIEPPLPARTPERSICSAAAVNISAARVPSGPRRRSCSNSAPLSVILHSAGGSRRLPDLRGHQRCDSRRIATGA